MQTNILCILVRFWGWTENEVEVAKDKAELSQLAKEGKPLYGESYMPEHIQDNSARVSRFSQLKFGKKIEIILVINKNNCKYTLGAIPWFNFANHNHHGVDTSKYNESS